MTLLYTERQLYTGTEVNIGCLRESSKSPNIMHVFLVVAPVTTLLARHQMPEEICIQTLGRPQGYSSECMSYG